MKSTFEAQAVDGRVLNILHEETGDTVDEPWTLVPPAPDHWYVGAEEFALLALGKPGGGRCLVIGSPLTEAAALAGAGWWVTHLDVRPQPYLADRRLSFRTGDATSIPFDESSFDAVSCTCVVCHAGLGRYGDRQVPHGDSQVMSEVARVLKPGGSAAMMFGPTMPWLKDVVILGRSHRVYSVDYCLKMAEDAGLVPAACAMWQGGRWLSEEDARGTPPGKDPQWAVYRYFTALLKKKE